MNSFFLILTAALVSIHQYLPEDNPQYKKYYGDVREVNEHKVFPAANQTCRYLYSVLAGAGLDAAVGQSGESGVGQVLLNIITSDKGFESILGMIDSPQMQEKLADKDITSEEVKNFFRRICASDFNPMSFTMAERQQVIEFLNAEVKVLDNEDLLGLGDFKSYGSVDIFDSSEKEIGNLGPVDQDWTPYNQISSKMVLSLLATEDEEFFNHDGVDADSIARMAKEAMTSNRVTGGSTLTMQLLKNMFFLNGPKSSIDEFNSGTSETLLRKVREWYWALPLEQALTKSLSSKRKGKEKVLELYLNVVNFGPRIQGIKQATSVYFKKDTKDLLIEEAAFISSLLKAPSFYSKPANYVEYSLPRRNDYIFGQISKACSRAGENYYGASTSELITEMCRLPEGGKIDAEYLDEREREPLPQWETPSSAQFDKALFSLRNYLGQWIDETIEKAPFDPKGLTLKTSIDSDLQKKVYEAVRKRLDSYDESRRALELVLPAKDDTGRQARLRLEDLGFSNLFLLDQIIAQGATTETQKLFYAVSTGSRGDIQRASFSTKEVRQFLNDMGASSKEIRSILSDLNKSLINQFTRPGQIQFFMVEKESFSLVDTQEVVNSRYDKEDLVEKALETLSPENLRNEMYRNSLQRMSRFRQREFLVPAILTDTGRLLNKDLEDLELTQVHQQYLRRKLNRPGLFFWLRPVSTDNSGHTRYALDAPRLQASVIVMNSNTGAILANFSGYDPERSLYDRSVVAKRQPGSTVKPWIYFLALNRGLRLTDVLENRGVSFLINDGRTLYRPKNFSYKWPTQMTLAQSLITSQNIATFSLLKDYRWFGGDSWYGRLQEVRNTFEKAGIYSEAKNRVSILIGSQETTLAQMVRSFSFFSNGHSIVDPYFVDKMMDYRGIMLHEAEPSLTPLSYYRPESVNEIQTLLTLVANQGTAASLRSFLRNLKDGQYRDPCFDKGLGVDYQTCLGGKTGTTNDGRDTWFVGFSKNFVIGVWVGYDENLPIGQKATGGSVALPIFKDVLTVGSDHLPEMEPIVDYENIPRVFRVSPRGNQTQRFEAPPTNSLPDNSFQPRPPVVPQVEPDPMPSVPQVRSLGCTCVHRVDSQGRRIGYSIRVNLTSGAQLSSRIHPNLNSCNQAKPNVRVGDQFVCR